MVIIHFLFIDNFPVLSSMILFSISFSHFIVISCGFGRGYKLSLGKEGDNFQRHHGRDPEVAN